MKRATRTFAWLVAGIVVGIGIAAIVLLTISRTEFGMERARRYALSWLKDRVDGEVKIGRLSGSGLLGGVTAHEFSIIDRQGRPFMRADSLVLSYDWRSFVRGQVIVDHGRVYGAQLWFEKLPGDTIWNFQHVFPDRARPGQPAPARRLILLNDLRFANSSAIVRLPLDSIVSDRSVIEDVPGGKAQVMRFDSLYGRLTRVIWESPTEEGKLIDVRTLTGRGFVWRDAMHVADARGTVTLRDTIVAFDMPDVRMGASRASLLGRVIMERGHNFYDVRVDTKSFAFRDIQWLYPKLPETGGGNGTLLIQSQRPKGTLWLATNTRLAAPGTRLAGSFGIVTGADSLYFTNVNLRASPLNLDLIQSMLPRKLPIAGLLVGTVELKGGLSSLETKGNVQLSQNGETQSAKWQGAVDLRNGLGARDFSADVQKFDLGIVKALNPDLNVRGQVSGHVEADGNFSNSVHFAADIHHYLSGYMSSFNGKGTYTGGTAPGLEVELNALPLSLEQLSKSYPALARLRGDARGPIKLTGSLNDMAVRADLETEGGRAQLNGRLTRTGDKPRYSGDATLYSFELDRLISDLPATFLEGTLSFDVAGETADDATGRLTARLTRGNIRGVEFRDGRAAIALHDGIARVDTLVARTMLGDIGAAGTLGLSENRTGNVAFVIRTDSLASVSDDAPSVTGGRVRARGLVSGSVASFDLNANVDIERLVYGAMQSDKLSATLKGTNLNTAQARLELRGRADSIVAYGEQADTTVFDFVYTQEKGDLKVAAGSGDGDEYRISAGVENRVSGMLFTLRDLQVGKHASLWKLARETTIETTDHGLIADTIEVARDTGARVKAAGRIAWHDLSHAPEPGQTSDFRLDFTGVSFEEFALVTTGIADMQGSLGGHVRVTGNAASPVLEGEASVSGFARDDARLDYLAASFTYAGERLNARVDGESAGRRVLFADGVIPVNLAFTPVRNRRLDENIRFSLQADSLPAAFLTAPVGGFTDVRGRIDGTLIGTGPTTRPEMSGSLTLKNGSGGWDVTGVRYRDVGGTIWIDRTRVATVDANVRTIAGAGHVTGTIDFAQPQNPGFGLTLNAQNFLAAKRRDADFSANGNVVLRGHYRQPIVSGDVTVVQGALNLDEIYRRYQIVELDNPLLYDVVDTSVVSLRTILPETTNPFIRNLVVDSFRVNVGREGWLRSRDLNVEVSGTLGIAFLLRDTLISGPRTAQDLVMTGTLRAVRGTYQLYYPGIARQFTIKEGTIEFPGTPGVDPNLGFNAVYRAAQRRGDPIDIVAVVGGSLRTPTVHLTSDQQPPISESDLASYLFFGVPTYELSVTQSAGLSQTGWQFAKSGVGGYLTSGLQSFAQNLGLFDYVSLTAAENAGIGIQPQSALATLFAGTRLELGRYLDSDGKIYVAYTQPLTGDNTIPGVRLEFRLMPTLTAEFFSEDRFARSYNFANTSERHRNWGFFLYREWGY